MGTWQPPPRAASAARSAVTAKRVGAWSRKADGVDGRSIVLAGFDAQRSLAGRRTKLLRIEPLADPIGLSQPLEASGGQQNRFHLPLGELAQPRVNIAAKLDGLDVGPERLQLRAAALAAGSHPRALRQRGQICVVHRNKYISRDRRAEAWQPV